MGINFCIPCHRILILGGGLFSLMKPLSCRMPRIPVSLLGPSPLRAQGPRGPRAKPRGGGGRGKTPQPPPSSRDLIAGSRKRIITAHRFSLYAHFSLRYSPSLAPCTRVFFFNAMAPWLSPIPTVRRRQAQRPWAPRSSRGVTARG